MSGDRSLTVVLKNFTSQELKLSHKKLQDDNGKWITLPESINIGEEITVKSQNTKDRSYDGGFSYSSNDNSIRIDINFIKPHGPYKTEVEIACNHPKYGCRIIKSNLQHHHSNITLQIDPTKHFINVEDLASNIKDQFLDLNTTKPEFFKYSGKADISIAGLITSHAQGICRNDELSIISYNCTYEGLFKDSKYGYLHIYNNNSKSYQGIYQLPFKDMNHPGGIQLIGDYLVIALQNNDYSKNEIVFLDIQNITCDSRDFKGIKPINSININLDGQKADAIAICNTEIDSEGKSQYLLAVCGGSIATFYLSNSLKYGLKDSDILFTKLGSCALASGYQGIQLLAQKTEDERLQYFLVAFDTEEESLSFKDEISLYELNISKASMPVMTLVKNHHVKTNYPAYVPAKLGVHCRFATGVYLDNQKNIQYLVTSSQTGVECLINKFSKK